LAQRLEEAVEKMGAREVGIKEKDMWPWVYNWSFLYISLPLPLSRKTKKWLTLLSKPNCSSCSILFLDE
jgi:hypothetical protein